jgi:hypothetical protein
MQGVRQGLHKLGHPSIGRLHERLAQNRLELERRSEGAKQEGQVHSLFEVSVDKIPSYSKNALHHSLTDKIKPEMYFASSKQI